ncbi:MAG: hypothetical protein NG747_13330 [Candidatus Brocadia sp.]|nr:hypothetical protein [Candidatus Brocadia sp.]
MIKKAIIAAGIVSSISAAAWAEDLRYVRERTVLYESIVVGTQTPAYGTSTLNSVDYNYDTMMGIYTVEGGNVRFKTDGTAPTANEGHLLYIKDELTVYGIADLRRFAVIAVSGTATIRATYRKK